jgi:hypothetical protein
MSIPVAAVIIWIDGITDQFWHKTGGISVPCERKLNLSMIFRNKKLKSADDYNDLILCLKKIQPEEISDHDKKELVDIMTTTEFTNLRGRLAMFLAATQDKSILPILIGLIRAHVGTKFIGSLIYASSNYDCHEYLDVFTDIIIVKDDMTVLDAFTVIQNIKYPVESLVKQYCLGKLISFREYFEEDFHKYLTLTQTIELIQALPEKD